MHLIAIGDFNCHVYSRFYPLLTCTNFALDNNLKVSDTDRITDGYTYYNSTFTCVSWIDHILCSPGIDALINSCQIHYEYICSDHKPILAVFNNLFPLTHVAVYPSPSINSSFSSIPDWSRANQLCIDRYLQELDYLLRKFDVHTDVYAHLMHSMLLWLTDTITHLYHVFILQPYIIYPDDHTSLFTRTMLSQVGMIM